MTTLFEKTLEVLQNHLPKGRYPEDAVRQAAAFAACIGISRGDSPFKPEYLAYFAEFEEGVKMLDSDDAPKGIDIVLLWICGSDGERLNLMLEKTRKLIARGSHDSAARELDRKSFERFAMLRRIICGECICELANAIAEWRAGHAMENRPGHAGADLVASMRDKIAEARKRGVTWDEIAEDIKCHTGMEAKPKTIAIAFSRLEKDG